MSLRLEQRYGKLLERMAKDYRVPKAEIVRRATVDYIMKWAIPGYERHAPPPDVQKELEEKS